MKKSIASRAKEIGLYVLSNKTTIREAALKFGLSKSTVHIDLSKRLMKIDGVLYEKIRCILDDNFSQKHIRGGRATKRKYLIKKLKI